ncbi:ATP-binding protein [Magnetospirillum fulvum]|uniref:Histidine kinase-like ATPase domain-containing protein n=1 Tax=Magnetospirillum fulvum TaxID=1082 RepID=A0A1H6H5Z3_MAGFU|nr:ATP-binding protein [Magnetospirillum fulvum]SEH30846.1 Histidine kinase-like ATPase domain-containing protein [Magnetospirillum fulvum]
MQFPANDLLDKATAWTVPGTGGALLVGAATEDAVTLGLSAPYRGFFEAGPMQWDDIDSGLRAAIRAGGLVLSLTTASAWKLDLTQLVTAAVIERFGPLNEARRHEIELCLSESLTNALLHGNLEMDSAPRNSLSGLVRYLDQIEERLRDNRLAAKRVDLLITPSRSGRLRVAVRDRGPGFDAEYYLDRPLVTEAKHGRGLPLIRQLAGSVAARDEGRTLVMRFSRAG